MIITENDISKLNGKFIIEINDDEEDKFVLNDENWDFYKEKRISFICGLSWNGFFYKHNSEKDSARFVSDFNPKNGRFRRLMTGRELKFMMNKLIQENY
jgi:hypothetical protein